jgi:hypothetical protein
MLRMLEEMKAKRLGHCFITDAEEPNPWSRLPRYWNEEVEGTSKIR